jgi:hypothetical protein
MAFHHAHFSGLGEAFLSLAEAGESFMTDSRRFMPGCF